MWSTETCIELVAHHWGSGFRGADHERARCGGTTNPSRRTTAICRWVGSDAISKNGSSSLIKVVAVDHTAQIPTGMFVSESLRNQWRSSRDCYHLHQKRLYAYDLVQRSLNVFPTSATLPFILQGAAYEAQIANPETKSFSRRWRITSIIATCKCSISTSLSFRHYTHPENKSSNSSRPE